MKYISTRDNKKTYNFVDTFLNGLAHDGGQHVHASAVRHANHNFFHAVIAGGFQNSQQTGHHGVAACPDTTRRPISLRPSPVA